MHDCVSIPTWVPFPQYSGLPSMVYLHEFSFPESICLSFGYFLAAMLTLDHVLQSDDSSGFQNCFESG